MHQHRHTKTDSEVTSLAPSSPTRSPRRPVYYVQSPSRDSHDGEKTNTTSFHSTPVLSPAGSPPHSHSSVGRHSRESSSTRFSGSLKPGSRKVNPTSGSRSHRKGGGGNGGQKPWKECDVIEEEGLLEDQESRKGLPRRCYFPAFVLCFFILFSFFALILYGAAKPQKPKITMRSITFETVGIQSGSDATGVSTDMMTLNSTVKFIYRNTASFFGVHVSSTPVDLFYDKITIASGDIKKFYQSRKTQRQMNVNVVGNKVPLYGSGASLSSATGKLAAPVALNLTFTVRSRAYVLGKLVKPKFYRTVNCGITLDPAKLNTAISLKNCTYN